LHSASYPLKSHSIDRIIDRTKKGKNKNRSIRLITGSLGDGIVEYNNGKLKIVIIIVNSIFLRSGFKNFLIVCPFLLFWFVSIFT